MCVRKKCTFYWCINFNRFFSLTYRLATLSERPSYWGVYMCAELSDYQVFCEILVQRPVTRSTIYLPSRMTAADLEYMQVMAQQHFDKIMAVLKDMPRPMLLIIRSTSSILACKILTAVSTEINIILFFSLL